MCRDLRVYTPFMTKSILVAGYGPGISHAVAEKFGRAGFSVALVARNQTKLDEGVKALKKSGITTLAFAADLGDLGAVKNVVHKVKDALGGVTVLHWNAAALQSGDLLTTSADELRYVLDV